MALRLADALGTEPEVWLDLQQQYDLWRASRRRRPKVGRILPPSRVRAAA
jgi:plasmid maintenance system antidote protein VapI